jgi:hypothetical protein
MTTQRAVRGEVVGEEAYGGVEAGQQCGDECDEPGVEGGDEVVVSFERVDYAQDDLIEDWVEEGSLVEESGDVAPPEAVMGGSQAGSAVNSSRNSFVAMRGGGPVRCGNSPDSPVWDAVRGCGSDSARGHQSSGRGYDMSDSADEDDPATTSPEVAQLCHSPFSAGKSTGTVVSDEAGGSRHPGQLSAVHGVSQDGRAGSDHILPPTDGPQPHGSAGPKFTGASRGDSTQNRRSTAVVSGPAAAGRGRGPDQRNVMAHHVRPSLPASVAVYDPMDIVSKVACRYSPEIPTRSGEGELDPVDPSLVGRLRLPANTPPSSPLGVACRLLQDEESMIHFVTPCRPTFVPSSRQHLRFVSELVESGLALKRSRQVEERGFAKFFTVVKKVREDGVPVLRTILDCRCANQAFSDPLPVNLPVLPQLLDAFGQVEEMRALDLRHWYHQIPISGALSKWFTVAFGSLRLQWNVLPMGWKWACFIAQAISTFAVAGTVALEWEEIPQVIRVGGVVFAVVYDNILAGGPSEELEPAWAALRARLDELNAIVKEEFIARNGSALPALGLEWAPSTSGLRWKLLDRLGEKAVALANSLPVAVNAKLIAGMLGVIAWSRYATLSDLCDLHPFYRRLSQTVARSGWGSTDDLAAYPGLVDLLRRIPSLGWQCHVEQTSEVLVFSDAHVTGYGFVGGDPLVAHQGSWHVPFSSADMFFLEAIAAKQAVLSFASPQRAIHLAVDNKALMFALRKRSTACPRTAVVLRDVFDTLRAYSAKCIPGWIPTGFNPADSLSRGFPLDVSRLRNAESHVEWTVPVEPRWGSTWGRAVG